MIKGPSGAAPLACSGRCVSFLLCLVPLALALASESNDTDHLIEQEWASPDLISKGDATSMENLTAITERTGLEIREDGDVLIDGSVGMSADGFEDGLKSEAAKEADDPEDGIRDEGMEIFNSLTQLERELGSGDGDPEFETPESKTKRFSEPEGSQGDEPPSHLDDGKTELKKSEREDDDLEESHPRDGEERTKELHAEKDILGKTARGGDVKSLDVGETNPEDNAMETVNKTNSEVEAKGTTPDEGTVEEGKGVQEAFDDKSPDFVAELAEDEDRDAEISKGAEAANISTVNLAEKAELLPEFNEPVNESSSREPHFEVEKVFKDLDDSNNKEDGVAVDEEAKRDDGAPCEDDVDRNDAMCYPPSKNGTEPSKEENATERGTSAEERDFNDIQFDDGENKTVATGMLAESPFVLGNVDFETPLDDRVQEKDIASLVFIFDTTGSMHDDLVQARHGAKVILNTFLDQEINPVSNYILVPFNDPHVGPINVTEEPNKFVEALDELSVRGGGDCPEMSATGILQALQMAHPNSYLYVFTDASAKDHYKYDQILETIQRKHSQVVFILTGRCRERGQNPMAFKVYDKIAAASSGQVFQLDKSNVEDVMNFVRDTLRARGITVFSVNRPAPLVAEPHTEDFNVTVEKDLEKLTVTLTGNKPTIEVRNPSGETPKDLKTVLNLPTVVVVNVDDPKPAGIWTVNVTVQPKSPEDSKSIPEGFTLNAKATGSNYKIHQGFSIQPAKSLKETAKRPLEGTENFLVAEIHPVENDPENDAELKKYNWKSVDFVKMDGRMLWSLPLKPVNLDEDEQTRVTKLSAGPFSPPFDLFNLVFNGVDGEGNPVSRSSPNAISAQHAAPPLITMIPKKTGFGGKNLTIKCTVESLLPFKLDWYKDGNLHLGNLEFEQSSEAGLTLDNIDKADEGDYKCRATNRRGSTLASEGTTVSVIEPPKITEMMTSKLSLPKGKEVILDCIVENELLYSVKWTRKHNGKIEELTSLHENGKFQLLSNNSLLISSLNKDDSGLYICSATNIAGTTSKEVELIVILPPEISTSPEEEFYFQEGDNIFIECKVVGNTKANLSWEFNEVTLEQFSKTSDDLTISLSIPQAYKDWEGAYVCVAVNEAGKAHKELQGIYFEAPTAESINKYKAVKEGEVAVMDCIVSGRPKPNVSWFHEENLIGNNEKYEISPNGLSLSVFNFKSTDAGSYKCLASGPQESESSGMFEVKLGIPPKPKHRPSDSSLSLWEEGWFPCAAENEADVNLFPEMKAHITWKKENGLPLDSKRHKVLESGTLHINNADISDEGVYICTIENAFGKLELEMDLEITGFAPPMITGMLEPQVVIAENKSVLLNCTVVTDLNYDVQWIHDHNGRHDEIPLLEDLDGKVQLLENNSIIISSLNKNDSGKYICSASNRAGTTVKEVELTVVSPPNITTSPEDEFYFIKGDYINISCTIEDNEKANISWDFNGIGVEQFSKSLNNFSKILLISEADKEWDGVYMCIAVNEAGKVHKEIKGIYVEPPEVISENQHVAAKADETAELICTASGYPKPTLIWYHNDHILQNSQKYEISSDGSSLKIYDSKPEDEGLYTCVAEGPRNTKSSSIIELILGRPPRPKEPYPYASLRLGEEGSFPCSAEYDEESHFPGMQVQISWKRKDRPLDSERHKVLQSGTLNIINSTTSDDGVYVCTLENDYGKLDLEMDLEIIGLVPPVIVPDGDEDISYLTAEEVTLWCNASGLPKPIISWFFKGDGMSNWERLGKEYVDKEKISYGSKYELYYISISGGKLSILNADYDNQGLYSCTAENEAGFAEKIFYLNMKAPPVLLDNGGPVDISLVEGESYSLHCAAKGAPEPSIKWIKDRMELPRDSFDGSYMILDGGLTLEVLAERGNTDGYYTCIAENEAGKVEKSFKLKVLVPPAHANLYLLKKPVSIQVNAGDSLKIACPIATGLAVPVPVYGWSKDGEMLHTEQVITSENGRSIGHLWIDDNGKSLHIDGVTLSDAGNYSCIGFNKAGRVVSHAADVEVLIPPNHYPSPENSSIYKVIEGEDITFNCSVMGVPKPKIIWTKDGVYLPENHPEVEFQHIQKEENVVLAQLSIPKVQGYHSGSYKCLSHNHVGKTSLLFDLNVLIPPAVQGSNNSAVEVVKGESASLNCSIIGNPNPTITWHKLNTSGVHEKIRENHIPSPSTLELQNIHHNESGVYICSGTNDIGSTKKAFNVSVLVAPSLEDDSPVVDMVTIGENITLECKPHGNPLPSIVWFKNGYLLGNAFKEKHDSENGKLGSISDDGRLMHLESVNKDSDGNYSCIAFNKVGRIERTFNIETVAPPSFYDWNIPDIVKVLNGSSVKFDCSASGKPKPKVQWTRLPPKDGLTTIQIPENKPPFDAKKGISATSQLFFESINPHNSAVYVCKAENKVGSTIKTFYLDVHVPPAVEGHIADENGELNRIGVIKKQPGLFTVQVIEGQTFKLSCRVLSGRPNPRLMWLKDGKRILKNIHQSQSPHRYFLEDSNSIAANGIYVIDSDETLVISNITEEESGPYKCVASNVAGTNEVHFNVEVFVPPTLEEGANIETEYSVKVHSFIALTCPVTGKPDPVIKWFKDSEEIDEDFANIFQISQDRQRLIIMQAEIENSGEYTCVAINDAGTRKINYKVSVLEEQMEWSPWSSWSACSSSCGIGTRKRYRECIVVQPNPKQIFPTYYRKSENQIELTKQNACPGDDMQIQKCSYEQCTKPESQEYQPKIRKKVKKVRSSVPKKATLNLQGHVNGQHLNPSFASASYDPWNNGPTLTAEVDVDPYEQGNLHPYLPFILSPLTWSTAGEVDEASNGYSLTDGVFEQHSQLEFMSGETLHLAHTGHGVDRNTGELKVHIEVEGEVPQYQSDALMYLEPYSEMYVQTSPSSLYAWSENDMNVDGQRLPYKWNSSLHYDSSMGTMGYLVEQLSLENLNTYNDYENRKIAYSASPKITKKYPTNRCPDGFNSDENNLHCIDVDECKNNLDKCHETQSCKNEMGSYQCLCPQGFISKNRGQQCIDVNECISGKNTCTHECHNTHGSFYCSCPKGLRLKSDGHTCENKDFSFSEVKATEKPKAPILDLLPDYHIVPLLTTKPPVSFWSPPNRYHDEISNGNSKDFHKDKHTSGWLDHSEYQKCQSGYISINGTCEDIDECINIHGVHKLRHHNQKTSPCPLPGQQCINTKGSYHCVEMSCSLGFNEVEVDFAHQNNSLRYCLQLCDLGGSPCQEKAEIAEIVVNAIITVGALKPRLTLAQFSVPITAKNEKNQTNTLASTTRTTFHKLDEETGSFSKQLLQLFRVRSEGTDGILYSMKEFKIPGVYRVAVMALTYNGYSHHVLYATKFVINIYVTGS